MPNTLLTIEQIAKESLLRLRNNLVMRQLVHTDFSTEFANKGEEITIRKPATFIGKDFTGTIDVQSAEESSVKVKLDTISDVSVEITSKELSLNIQDFGIQIAEGAMQALAQKIDNSLCGLYIDIPYFSGVGGQTPSKLANIADARKILGTHGVPLKSRSAVWDPEAEAKLLILDSIVNAEKSGSTDALKEANLGRVLGFDNFGDQNIRTHAAGAYTALADVTVTTGAAAATSIVLTSGAGASIAKLNQGDLMTIDGNQYVVTEQTLAAVAGVVTAKIYPALKAAAVGKAVAFQVSHVANLAFHRNAFCFVNRPQALPMGGATGYIANFEGLSIRVTMGYTMSSKVNTISFDILHGQKTLQPELACRAFGTV